MRALNRIISVLTAACLICAVFSSCSKSSQIIVRTAIDENVSCLDPQIATGSVAKNIIANCFEGLVGISENGSVESGVATSWDVSSDGLTYTFHLNPKAKWHVSDSLADVLGETAAKSFDNSVTAYDFEFAFKRAVDPLTNAPDVSSLYMIKNAEKISKGKSETDSLGVSAVDKTTFVITLEKPYADFLYILASPICMPCNEEFFEATSGRYGLSVNLTLCNGPFYLLKWIDDEFITIYKNSYYYNTDDLKIDAVKYYVNSDKSTYTESLKSDSGYDSATITKSMTSDLKNDCGIKAFDNTVYALIFNCSKGYGSNADFRKAVAYATDFSVFTGENLTNSLVPSCLLLSSDSSYSSTAKSPYSLDLSKSLNCWNSAGYSGDISLSLICPTEYEAEVKKIVQNWQKVFGITVSITLTSYDAEKLKSKISSGSFDIAFAPISSDDILVSDYLNGFTTDSADNSAFYSDSDYDSAVSDIFSSANNKELQNNCLKAEQTLLDNAVILPAFTSDSYVAVKKSVTGIYYYPSGTIACYKNCKK